MATRIRVATAGFRNGRVRRAACTLMVATVAAALPVSASESERRPERVERLSDSLEQGADWVIAMPQVDEPIAFDEAVRRGIALDSDAYLELHRELRDALRSDADGAEATLSDLRDRLRNRAETNARLGYIYAAGVYIEMLDIAGAPADDVEALTRELAQRRAFESDFDRFERALAQSRLRAPADDSAVFWLERLRDSPVADPERIRRAEASLRAALGADGAERSSP